MFVEEYTTPLNAAKPNIIKDWNHPFYKIDYKYAESTSTCK